MLFRSERLGSFDDKPIRSITQGAASLSAAEGEAPDMTALLARLKTALSGHVSEVRATDRLVESAAVLAAGEYGPDLAMQRLLRRAGRGFAGGLPVLEVNPRHAWMARLDSLDDAALADQAGLLFDLARLQDGDAPRDPADFARRVAQALAG